mmetsp:Transcript_26819/g.77531  ORF Transcript_26819/g.77531 Transcript_26819/m.77531 type:complete len:239 (-) Transcript_26819:152-868(-)
MASLAYSQVQGITTMMVRNLPRKYTSWELVREVARFFPPSEFDFVYVPWDKNGHSNMGLGFVNFRNGTTAAKAPDFMNGHEWTCTPFTRRMQVQRANQQGLAENLRSYRRNTAKRGMALPQHSPVVFEDGRQIPMQLALEKYASDDAASLQRTAHRLAAPASKDDGFFQEIAEVPSDSVSVPTWSSFQSMGSSPTLTEGLLPPLSLSATPTLDDLALLVGGEATVGDLMSAYKGPIAF